MWPSTVSPVRRPKRRICDGRDVDVVGAGQVVRFRRAQEAEAVGEHFDDAFADDVDLLGRELLQDREHQLLLAHGAGVLDLVLFGEGEEFGRSLGLEVLEFHFPHGGFRPVERDRRRCKKIGRPAGSGRQVGRRSGLRGASGGRPGARCCARPDSVGAGTRLHPPAFGGCAKHRWSRTYAQEARGAGLSAKFRVRSLRTA